jgi:hypothetical protein
MLNSSSDNAFTVRKMPKVKVRVGHRQHQCSSSTAHAGMLSTTLLILLPLLIISAWFWPFLYN